MSVIRIFKKILSLYKTCQTLSNAFDKSRKTPCTSRGEFAQKHDKYNELLKEVDLHKNHLV